MLSPFSIRAPSSYRLLSFSRVLCSKGHHVTLVLPNYDRHSGFLIDKNFNFPGIKLINPYQLKTRNLSINMFPYVASAILKNASLNYDIVHILKPTPITSFGYLFKPFHIPIVLDIDDLDHLVMQAEKNSPLSTWVMYQSERLFPKLANKIIVSCSYLKQLYSQIDFQKNKIVQISNGVSVKDFNVKPDLNLKNKYNLKDKVVVYVGSLNNYDQLLPIIFSMQKVIKERRDTCCLIIGDGKIKNELEVLVRKLGLEEFFVFTGRIYHNLLPNFLSVSDLGLACFPSAELYNYASNIKVFEYLASGLPVIVSPTGDLPYYIDYGRAGIVSQPDFDHLSKALLKLLSDDRKRKSIGIHAKEYAKNFDWETLTKNLLNVYSQLKEKHD